MNNRWPIPLSVRHQVAYIDAIASLVTPGGTFSAEAAKLWHEITSPKFSTVEEFSVIEDKAHTPFEQQLRLRAHMLYEVNPERKP